MQTVSSNRKSIDLAHPIKKDNSPKIKIPKTWLIFYQVVEIYKIFYILSKHKFWFTVLKRSKTFLYSLKNGILAHFVKESLKTFYIYQNRNFLKIYIPALAKNDG